MGQIELCQEIISTYRKHGWQLRRALLTSATQSEVHGREVELFGAVACEDSVVDALWFARPSHQNREAWELRLVAESQYALFESFGPDVADEQRQTIRHEMQVRMCERLQKNLRASGSGDPTSLE